MQPPSKSTPAGRPPTKRPDPNLAGFCAYLADVAELSAGATHALLINANRVRLNLGIPRGGTVLLLRFPAAAIERDEPALQELLAAHEPKPVYTIHTAAERLPGAASASAPDAASDAHATAGAALSVGQVESAPAPAPEEDR